MPSRKRPPPRQRPSRLRPLLMAPSKLRNVVNPSPPSRSANTTRSHRCCIERLLNPSPTSSRSGHETVTPAAPFLVTPIPPVFTSPAAVPPARSSTPHGGAQLDAPHPPPQEHGPSAAASAYRFPARGKMWPKMDEKERLEMEYTAAIMLSLHRGWPDNEENVSAAGSEEVGGPVGTAGSGETIGDGAGGASRDEITGAMHGVESIRSRMRIERFLVDV